MLNFDSKQRCEAFVIFHWRSLCCWLFAERKTERG